MVGGFHLVDKLPTGMGMELEVGPTVTLLEQGLVASGA